MNDHFLGTQRRAYFVLDKPTYRAKCHICGAWVTIIVRPTTAGAPVCETCRESLIEGVEGPEDIELASPSTLDESSQR